MIKPQRTQRTQRKRREREMNNYDAVRVDRGVATSTSPSERNVKLSLHSAP
jgi:hypothetical protein